MGENSKAFEVKASFPPSSSSVCFFNLISGCLPRALTLGRVRRLFLATPLFLLFCLPLPKRSLRPLRSSFRLGRLKGKVGLAVPAFQRPPATDAFSMSASEVGVVTTMADSAALTSSVVLGGGGVGEKTNGFEVRSLASFLVCFFNLKSDFANSTFLPNFFGFFVWNCFLPPNFLGN